MFAAPAGTRQGLWVYALRAIAAASHAESHTAAAGTGPDLGQCTLLSLPVHSTGAEGWRLLCHPVWSRPLYPVLPWAEGCFLWVCTSLVQAGFSQGQDLPRGRPAPGQKHQAGIVPGACGMLQSALQRGFDLYTGLP